MNVNRTLRARRLGLVGAAAVALGLASASAAGAAPSFSASVANDTLTVNGSGASNFIALRLAANDPNVLEVDFGDNGSAEGSFDRSTFSRIEVFLRDGNDEFRMDQVNGTFADEVATIDGGSGNDTMNGGDGAELFLGGSGRDTVDGNRGDDTARLGSDRDIFRWDPGDGSDIVEGDTGTDTLDFNGAGGDEVMSLSANGQRSLFLRDVANIRMDMDNVERLDLTALGGVDNVTINDMTGTDFVRAIVDTGGADAAADIVTVNGTANADDILVEAEVAGVEVRGLQTGVRVNGSETIDRLQVNTLDGDDDVEVEDDVSGFIGVVVDLGPGQI